MNSPSRIKLIVFDMDGTITRPRLDFGEIRKAIGNDDPSLLSLDFILSLPPDEQKKAWEIMHRYEDEAAENAEPQAGAVELLAELRRRGIKTAIFTRNSRKSVETVLSKIGVEVDRIIAREDAPPKPDPRAINELMERYAVHREEVLMVGDFALDIEAGRQAGIATVLLRNGDNHALKADPDFEIDSLLQLREIIAR
ncbi:MAG TPA: HAD family hydrolase [Acidobacteriota bacterium]|nr:HAD family hydrolase [Acidobacteriota bacterium]